MRTIKFRAWDKKLKRIWDMKALFQPYNGYEGETTLDAILMKEEKWSYKDPTKYNPNNFYDMYIEYKFDDFVLMQYTGLNDRYGKEIYEGDGLKINIGNESDAPYNISFDVTVTFSDGMFITDGGNSLKWAIDESDSVEVIGNIYENKDLINNKQS